MVVTSEMADLVAERPSLEAVNDALSVADYGTELDFKHQPAAGREWGRD